MCGESWEFCNYNRLIRSEGSMELPKLETVSKNRVGVGSYRTLCPWPMCLAWVVGISHNKIFTKAMTRPQIHLYEVLLFLHLVFRYLSMVSISEGGQEWLRESSLVQSVKTQELYFLLVIRNPM